MRAASDSLGGSPTFHIEVNRRGDGKFVANAPSCPQLPPTVGNSETEAIRDMRMQLEQAMVSGKLLGAE